MDTKHTIVDLLFKTSALQVCDKDRPFWYTSGKLGPYYINTHYLYGSPQEASDLLNFMATVENAADLPAALYEKIMIQLEKSEIYRQVIDLLLQSAENLEFDFISGGERRDFFFSIPLAAGLNLPHLSIMKDMSAVYSEKDFSLHMTEGSFDLKGRKALHVADLITAASSYLRAWIPVIRGKGALITDTIAVVDRNQGGGEALRQAGVDLHAAALIGPRVFSRALEAGFINQGQFDLISSFTEDPDLFMVKFFKDHPNFLQEEIALGGQNKDRALLCMEKGYHTEKVNG